MTETMESLARRIEVLEATNDGLAARVRRAERRGRVLAAAGFVALAASVALFGHEVAAQEKPQITDVIRAHSIAVYDEDGNVRGIFSGEKGKVGVALLDKKGKVRIGMIEKNGTPLVSCSDENGNVRFVAGVDAGAGAIEIDDKEGNAIFKKP